MRLFIISNRLPVRMTREGDRLSFTRSEGGLATGLGSLQIPYEKHWIGWPGICTDDPQERKTIGSELRRMHFHPVFLSEAEIENYYEGYSNSTIWPLCHYFYAYTLYKSRFWEAYREVNRRFCEEICRVVEPGDRVWVQDYHLMLLPGMLREAMPDLCIGYFHHIPFPSYELFRILPERARLLRGLLGADFIAFHTPDYMRHFVSAAQHILNVEFRLDEAQLGSRTARVDALPMGINYDLYHKAASKIQVRDAVEKYRRLFGDRKLILSVDRLDYSKGILHRLQLEQHIRRLACDALLLCCGKHPVERIADHLGAAHNVQQPVGTEDVFLLGTNRILCKYHRFFLLFLCFYEHYTNCFVTFPVYIQKSDRSIKKASLCRGRQAGRPRGVTRGRPSRPRPRRRRPWRCRR